MKNKTISFNNKLSKWFDTLPEKEEVLALYLQIANGHTPKHVSILGFLINPLTVLPDGAKRVATNFQEKLRKLYLQNPLLYIRMSANMPMLQRIMVLEQPTTMNFINNPNTKTEFLSVLKMKLLFFNVDIKTFNKGLKDLNGGFIVDWMEQGINQ